jgi:parallel beta-helix repeat protein
MLAWLANVAWGEEHEIAADDVTLRLAGHRIVAGAAGADFFGIGIRTESSDAPWLRVDIRDGTVDGFDIGVAMFANDSSVRKLTVSRARHGINLGGGRNYADRNVVDIPVPSVDNREAILFLGDDAYASHNLVTGFPFHGVIAQGERPRLVSNRVQNCGAPDSSIGVGVDLYTTFAVVDRNTVSGCYEGIIAVALDGSFGGAEVRLNAVTGGRLGMRVRDRNAIVDRNTATGASQDGIHLELPGTTVRRNTANDNGRYGIFGPVGTIDGGGNTASGNGDGTTPQCVNVSCGP